MAADHIDIRVPPECSEMIRAGALVAINHSGGKDSQAMTILLSRFVPRDRLVAVHAPLGEVEWPGTIEHIEATLFDMSAAPVPVCEAHHRRRLRARLLRAGRTAVDDRELLELLLSGRHAKDGAGDPAGALLDAFGTAPRALAARPDRLRTVPGLSEDAVAVLKAAEALGIRMAREEVPETVRPTLGSYTRVIEYCRTLAGHREVEEFHILYLDRQNALIADECHQRGTVCHTPVYPREICIRCLELQASAIVALHPHPSGDLEPSRADIDMTRRIKDALKTIEVTLLDHVIVTPTGSVSFQARGLL